MAIYAAYFDVSGSPDANALTMAGYVADVDKWKRFEERWQDILAKQHIKIFHMTDFASGHGEFEGWREKPEIRKRFLADLQDCAREFTDRRISASVVIADYNEVNKKYVLEEAFGRPYSFCGISCIEHVRTWATEKKIQEVVFAFEDGDKDQGNFKRICGERFRPPMKPHFLLKANYVPFQAADLAAWKTRHPIREAVGDKDYTLADVEKLLASTKSYLDAPHSGGVFDYNSLMKICVGYNVRLREKADAEG